MPTAAYLVRDEVWKCLADFRLPDSLGFGLVAAPVMYSATFEGGQWKQGELLPYGAMASCFSFSEMTLAIAPWSWPVGAVTL